MTNTEIRCPECGDRFLIPVHCLSDALGRPLPEAQIAQYHACDEEVADQ